MYGITLGIVFIIIFTYLVYSIKDEHKIIKHMNDIVYLWLSFTIMTGIWELCFILNYNNVSNYAAHLIKNEEHIWDTQYSMINLFPHLFSKIYYAEYGAYADREYMSKDDWSRVIESTHCIFCGIFSLLAIHYYENLKLNKYMLTLGISMGSQCMNSILYMINYFNEIGNPNSINYNNSTFPTGYMLNKRPFMYINIFWTIMPIYVMLYEISYNKLQKHMCAETQKKFNF